MNEIVKYRNEMNKVALRNFTSKELDLFMAIVSRMREKGEEEITFTFDYLKKLIKYETSHSIDLFYKDLKSMYDKLIQCVWGWENEKEIVRFVLFTRYKIDKDSQSVKVKVNDEFIWVLNILTEGLFTRFELEEFINLKSSYTKEFFRRMKQFRSTGIWKVSLDEFKRLLDIPVNYRICDIDKWVLLPIKKELGKKYNLKIQKNYTKNKKGRPGVSGFNFTFKKEKKECKEKKVIVDEIPLFSVSSKNLDNYIGRTVRMKDLDYDRFNLLSIKKIENQKGKILVMVQNRDDGFENEMIFDSSHHFENWFEKFGV